MEVIVEMSFDAKSGNCVKLGTLASKNVYSSPQCVQMELCIEVKVYDFHLINSAAYQSVGWCLYDHTDGGGEEEIKKKHYIINITRTISIRHATNRPRLP